MGCRTPFTPRPLVSGLLSPRGRNQPRKTVILGRHSSRPRVAETPPRKPEGPDLLRKEDLLYFFWRQRQRDALDLGCLFGRRQIVGPRRGRLLRVFSILADGEHLDILQYSCGNEDLVLGIALRQRQN